jgi:hypothetical protein
MAELAREENAPENNRLTLDYSRIAPHLCTELSAEVIPFSFITANTSLCVFNIPGLCSNHYTTLDG